jgi:hypothetical protein
VNPAPVFSVRSSRAFQIRNGELVWTRLLVDELHSGGSTNEGVNAGGKVTKTFSGSAQIVPPGLIKRDELVPYPPPCHTRTLAASSASNNWCTHWSKPWIQILRPEGG